MRRFVRHCLIAFAPLLASRAANAQRPDSAFVPLRTDGNGIADLQTIILVGFSEQTASNALTQIATLARLNLTFDPQLAGLSTKLSIGSHVRTAAAALIEVANQSHVRIRVSPRGQIVVDATNAPSTAAVVVTTDTVTRGIVALPPIRSEAQAIERQRFETMETIGAVSIGAGALRNTPSFVEPDLLRAVQALPGVEARSDWSAGFNVRGGEADQNLILVDGYPIYSPFHLGGMFSTFIDPTVGRVDLRKGGMPARYGGRLSSVLDVSSAEPTSPDYHGTMELSLVSAIGSVGQTFANGNGSWMIAGRRTYADAVVNLIKQDAFPYHFQDVQGHVTRRFDSGLRVSLTAYDGLDVAATSDTTGEEAGGNWSNSVVGITVGKAFTNTHAFGHAFDSIKVEQRLSHTRFANGANLFGSLAFASNAVSDDRLNGTLAFHDAHLTQTVGYELSRQRIAYHASVGISALGGLLPSDSLSFLNSSASAFIDELWHATSSLLIEGGLRLDAVSPMGWKGLSPRLSAKYFLTPTTAITAAGGSYAQWVHSLGREEEPVQPFSYWVGSDSTTPVSRARDVSAGLERWLTATRLLHVEAFYKRFQNLLTPNVADDPRVASDEFTPTGGSSYGIDALLRQLDGGPFSGWIAYSYSFNTRIDPDGNRYFPTQDRRHNLNLVGSWRTGAYMIGARANFASGLPSTPVLGNFVRDRYDATTHRWVRDPTSDDPESLPGARNSMRLPWYSRIDFSVTRTGHAFGASLSPYLSVVNVLNSHNPAAYLYSFTGRPEQASFPNLPFIPTFGVSIVY